MYDKVYRPLYTDSDGHEMVCWVMPGVPLTIFSNHFSADTFDYLDWHWHEEVQFCLALKGNICIEVDTNIYLLEEGEAVFINSCHRHKVCRDTREAIYVCFNIASGFPCQNSDYGLYRKYKEPFMNLETSPAVHMKQGSSHALILEILKQMWTVFQGKNFGYELELWSMLLQLWKELTQIVSTSHVGVEEVTDRNAIRLHRIITFIRREYANNFSLVDVANSVYLSRSECSRFFKKEMGCSIFDYAMRYRIDKSIELLQQTDKKISVIAMETGFSSQSYYTECFKRHTGLTPKQFREMRRSEAEAAESTPRANKPKQ